MLLDEISIQSFKSIANERIELGRVNVLIGANGSGKSCILEALGVLSAAVSGRVDDSSLMRRGVRPGVPCLYKSAHEARRAPHILLDGASAAARYRVTLHNPLEKPRPAWEYKSEALSADEQPVISRGVRSVRNKEQGLIALTAVDLAPGDPVTSFLEALRDYAIFSPNTATLRGLTMDQQSRVPVGLSGGGLAEAIDALRKLARKDEALADELSEVFELIDWAVDVDTVTSAETLLSSAVPRPNMVLRFEDRYMRGNRRHLTAYDASEGALYVLFCAALALSPSAPPLFAIDNVDQALNPRLAQRLVAFMCAAVLRSGTRQILMTAHNPATLDGLPFGSDDVRLFAVDRNSDGHTRVRRVALDEGLKALAKKKDWPLSRLWAMGHLGGVPGV